MDSCSLPLAISALSSVIASHLNDHELVLVVLVFTQIGETLRTISAQRACCSAGSQPMTLQAEPTVAAVKTPAENKNSASHSVRKDL